MREQSSVFRLGELSLTESLEGRQSYPSARVTLYLPVNTSQKKSKCASSRVTLALGLPSLLVNRA